MTGDGQEEWEYISGLSKDVVGGAFYYNEEDWRRSNPRTEEFSSDHVNFEMLNMHPFEDASLTIGFTNLKFWDKI